MWMNALQVVVLLAMLNPAATSNPNEGKVYAGEPVVSLELSTYRAGYYVGEPMRLKLRVRNLDNDAFIGFFHMMLRDYDHTDIYYRRSDGAFTRFKVLSDEEEARAQAREVAFTPVVLEAKGEHTSSVTLVFAADVNHLLLDRPGTYEFMVRLHAAHRHPEHVLESNIVSVRVEPVPRDESAAFVEYQAKGLAVIVPSAALILGHDKEAIRGAGEFVEHHPRSIYARPIRIALLQSLRARVLQNRATHEQKALFDRLKDSGADENGDDDPDADRVAKQERQERKDMEKLEQQLRELEAKQKGQERPRPDKPTPTPSPTPEGHE